jgi:hypothetical protein
VTVHLQYDPPAGAVGQALAMLFGEEPEQQLQQDLRRFKQVLETGEIARSRASESVAGMGQPARPGDVPSYSEFERGER